MVNFLRKLYQVFHLSDKFLRGFVLCCVFWQAKRCFAPNLLVEIKFFRACMSYYIKTKKEKKHVIMGKCSKKGSLSINVLLLNAGRDLNISRRKMSSVESFWMKKVILTHFSCSYTKRFKKYLITEKVWLFWLKSRKISIHTKA